MGYVAKLTKGTSYIDLNAGRYKLAEDFVPPTTNVSPFIGQGGVRVGEMAQPRDWGFGVRVLGASSAEVKRGADDLANFLRRAGDEAEPLYFEWKEDSNVSVEPVWGQFGATRRMEITSGSVGYWESYAIADIRTKGAFVPVYLTIKPWAQGARQILATAKGGICEDWIGTTDGRSRGLQIPEGDATNGNKMTNPVFGHATWNTGWTAGADVIVTKNTDPRYILFGLASAKIVGDGGAADYYTQSIAAGGGAGDNHVLSCYAKLPNGGVISATQCSLYYGANAVTTYTAVGNGWYRLTAPVEGVVAATITGITVENEYTVYVDAFQLEQRDYATSFFYGDMLGCAWAGTHHASKSTRTAPTCYLPIINTVSNSNGSARIVWKADKSSASFTAGTRYELLFSDELAFDFYLTTAAGINWSFDFAASSCGMAAAFSTGDIIIIHLVWSITGVNLYVNNVIDVSAAAYDAPALASTIYIGSRDDALLQVGGTFMGLQFFDHRMTSGEVAADYANVLALVSDNQNLDPIPYIWTKDGDNIVDYIDSGAFRNIATVGGVPGDAPAKTEFKAVTAGMNSADVYIGLLDLEYSHHVDPEFLTNIGVAPPDVIAVTNVDIQLTSMTIDDDEFRILAGRRIAIMLRADDAGNNIIIKTGVYPGGAYYYSPQLATTWTIGSITNDLTPEVYFPSNDQLYRELGITRAAYVAAVGKRTAAGALDFDMYSSQIMPFPMLRFVNTSAVAAATTILYLGNGQAREINAAALSYMYTVRGDIKDWGLVPGRYNWLVSYLGKEAVVTDNADTLTYSAVYITPRWLIA